MKKTSLWRAAALAVSLSVALPMAAHAHRAWMLPSATVLSGNEPWVTVDAAVSNDLFYFCLLYTSPSPRDQRGSRMPSSA